MPRPCMQVSRAVHKIIITIMFKAMKRQHNAYSLHLMVTKKEQKQLVKKLKIETKKCRDDKSKGTRL